MNQLTSNRPSPVIYILKWSLIMGITGLIYNAAGAYFNLLGRNFYGWILFAVFSIVSFLSIKNYRNKLPGKEITFGRAFSLSLLLYLFAGTITAGSGLVMQKIIFPAAWANMQQINDQKLMADKSLTDEEITNSIRISHNMANNIPLMLCIGIFMFLLVGAIVSLVTAAILKKEPAEFIPEES
jgi:hypothetical protein